MCRKHNDRNNNRSILAELLQSKGIVEDGKRIKKELRDMTTKRFMVDDAGTLVDMETRETYDYVSDVYELLNELHEETLILKRRMESKQKVIDAYDNYIKTLKEDGVLE